MAITPLLPQSSSQIAMANSKKMGERRSSLALKRRFSDKLFFGLFGRRINENPQKPKPKFIVGGNAKLGRHDSDDDNDDDDDNDLNRHESRVINGF